MASADYWIRKLDLKEQPRPGHGFFKEIFRSSIRVENDNEERKASSSVYFLRLNHQRGFFHSLASDEYFFYHAGDSLTVFYLDDTSPEQVVRRVLGPGDGQELQLVVPAHRFLTFFVEEENKAKGFSLYSVVVSPGFDPRYDVMGTRTDLLKKFPKQAELITSCTDE